MRLKLALILSYCEAVLFFAGPLAKHAFAEPALAAAWELTLLPLIIWPAACWCAGFAMELSFGFSPALPILTGLLFLPASWLHYGTLPLNCAAVYAGMSLMGSITAYPIRTVIRLRRERKAKLSARNAK